MIDGRRLLAWGDLDERRRRGRRRGVRRLPPLAQAAIAGALLAGEIARRVAGAEGASERAAAVGGASQLWIAAVVALSAVLVFGAPFRLYWRRDSALLARLAIPGRALLGLALARTGRAVALAALPAACGALALGALGGWELALRHLAVLAAGAAGGFALGPAAAVAAGAIVASDRAQALIDSFGGELQAPKTSWLGALPGFAATAVALVVIALAPWAVGGRPPGGSGVAILVGGIAVPLATLAWAWAVADRVLLAAVREVAALDQEILAHVERSTASPLERAWARLTCGPRARILFDKDARLSRRRYPSPYFLFPLGVLALWILAAARPASLLPWAGVLLASLAVYAIIMARRAQVPPIEEPRFLATLALAPADVRRGKRSPVLLRALVVFGLGGGPVVARADSTWAAALLVLSAAAVALAFGLAPGAERGPR